MPSSASRPLIRATVAAYIYGAGIYRANSCAHHRSETRSKTPAAKRSRPGAVRVTSVRRQASQGSTGQPTSREEEEIREDVDERLGGRADLPPPEGHSASSDPLARVSTRASWGS